MTTSGVSVTVYVGTGWKMNKTIPEAQAFVGELNAYEHWPDDVQTFILPPHTALQATRDSLDPRTGVRIGAQNAHWMPHGAYTGEISMGMIRDAGATMVELGHSERREYFNETDETVSRKVASAIEAGITPLICVGESDEVRRAGREVAFVLSQAQAAMARIGVEERPQTLIAYEPVWSIGAGGRAAEPGEAAAVIAALSSLGAAAVLYGGSVDRSNAAALLTMPGVGGLFVGRAAWEARGLLDLVEIARDVVGAPRAG